MSGALSDLFYRHGRLTALTLGLIMVLGLSAFTTLARQSPTMTERYGFVKTFLPGPRRSGGDVDYGLIEKKL